MAADSTEVFASEQQKWKRVVILNYGMPHDKFNINALARKYQTQGIDTSIVEISPATNQLAQPLPFKIDEKTKVIVIAHGSPNSYLMGADTGESLTVTDLAKIIADNMEKGVTKLQVSLGLCNGGIGESNLLHETSFAGHLVRALSEYGIVDSVVSARLGFSCTTAKGRGQVQLQKSTDENPFLKGDYFRYATEKNQERYTKIYGNNYMLRPPAGKLPGSKVVLSPNEEGQLISSYPYGKTRILGLGGAHKSIHRHHSNYMRQHQRIQQQAKEVYSNIVTTSRSSSSMDSLFKYSEIVGMLRKIYSFCEISNICDSETLVSFIHSEIEKARQAIDVADTPVLERFEQELTDKIHQAPQLRLYLTQLEYLKSCDTTAIGEIEDKLFTIDKKRRMFGSIEATADLYDNERISSVESCVERFKFHVRKFLIFLHADTALLHKLSAVISLEDAITFALECKNEWPQISEMLEKKEYISLEHFGRLFITRHNSPISLEDLEALSVEEQVAITQLVGKEEQGVLLDAREEGLKNAYVSLAKLNRYKKFIRDLFTKKQSPSSEFFSTTEEMPAQIVNMLAAKDLTEMWKRGRSFLEDKVEKITEETKFKFKMVIITLGQECSLFAAEEQAISLVRPNPEENQSGSSSMTHSC
ncbi:MAG: hypothetical protein K0R48_636 [Gammaproteobacteria bacterium]|jgi:hypothetical protein|nr:hypothetical protein [Gammaproteobacteria bacterium]